MNSDNPLSDDLTEAQSNSLLSILKGRPLPKFIAVEGPVGVGKTTLSKKLANTFGYELVLEQAEENPFLGNFYKNRNQYALATQLFFLFQRTRQIQDMRQSDLFAPNKVSDFLIDKDRLFAKINLDKNEYDLYEKVYSQLTIDAPAPDLVIYLQAPVDILMERIYQRGVNIEQSIDRGYIEMLNQAYSEFFLYYDEAPTLIINCADINFQENDDDFYALIDYMLDIKGGRHYFNPTIFS